MRSLAAQLREARPERFEVACLPDFFLDTVVPMAPWPQTRDAMGGIAERKGGSLPTAPHRLSQGGNAANTALALARLGVRARLVAATDALGAALAQSFLEPHGVDLSRLRRDATLSSTVALECGPERRNIMLSHPGPVADFGPERLDERDWAVLLDSDAVLLSNWVLNQRGTALATEVLSRTHRHGALTYFDSGDPSSRAQDVPGLFRDVLAQPWLRVLGCNENEVAYFARAAGDATSTGLLARAQAVRRKVQATVDLHTRDLALSLGPRDEVAEAKPPAMEGVRATGAGDNWNAGNLLGHLLGLAPEERLRFANAVATCYVTAPEPLPPAMADVIALLERVG